MARARTEGNEQITKSSGNVFADLGFRDADERLTKVRLAAAINKLLESRNLSQVDAARRLGVNQPRASALANYRLESFSIEHLMLYLTMATS
jgi:predicted XRE-type DNA-binding protein